MKKFRLFWGGAVLVLFFGLALAACGDGTPLEEGIGTVKLTNTGTKIIDGWWLLRKYDETIWSGPITLNPGASASQEIESSYSIKVHFKDSDGIVWLSNTSYTVRKDQTVEVKFPKDFSQEPKPGVVKLINNSQNVTIVYWSIEKNGQHDPPLWEEHRNISPRTSASHEMENVTGIKVYLEIETEDDDYGWLTKSSYSVEKNKTVEIKFPGDFLPE
ncbi:hypothetical protein FACS1894151_03780 [Spirochaetia bacterium]|nr:hypothetical protein FACS1894151_03780 [Spirochaetia bacterium]